MTPDSFTSTPAGPPEAVKRDRVVGTVLASAAGDALGAPHEFGPALAPSVVLEMSGGGVLGWEPGEWTDDTQTALAILEPLAAGLGHESLVGAVSARLANWYASDPPDVGDQTRAVLGEAARSGRPLGQVAAEWQSMHPEAAGNGSLMRTGPVALAGVHGGLGNDRLTMGALAAKVSALTHAGIDAVESCVLWADAIRRAVNADVDPDGLNWVGHVAEGLTLVSPDHQSLWRERLDEARAELPETFTPNGYVVRALQAALSSLHHTPVPTDQPCRHLVDALSRAIRIGDDTDTVGAICGALAGAYWGATAVPLAWRELLHGRAPQDSVRFTGGDLERLARLASTGGEDDKAGWPSVDFMVPEYAKVWPDTVVLGELDDHVMLGNVFAVAGALDQVDTVVSLCRMGRHEVGAKARHYSVGLLDTTAEENPNLSFVLADTAAFVAAEVAAGRRVLVHCVMAHNRTPTVGAAYLMLTQGLSVDDALARARAVTGTTPKEFLIDGLRTL